MIGQGDPNMGKSSVINSVFGKKLVSSSATPGGCAAAPPTEPTATTYFLLLPLLPLPLLLPLALPLLLSLPLRPTSNRRTIGGQRRARPCAWARVRGCMEHSETDRSVAHRAFCAGATGHTKHFQTLFLSKAVCFCDSPGIVCPKLGLSKPLQARRLLTPVY
jgi:hypothetical protein